MHILLRVTGTKRRQRAVAKANGGGARLEVHRRVHLLVQLASRRLTHLRRSERKPSPCPSPVLPSRAGEVRAGCFLYDFNGRTGVESVPPKVSAREYQQRVWVWALGQREGLPREFAGLEYEWVG